MDSIVEKITEIEDAAEAIAAHAQEQKGEIERKVQDRRNRFDEELENKTQEKLQKIRRESDAKKERMLKKQREKNQCVINEMHKEFEENHTRYAREILERITEV